MRCLYSVIGEADLNEMLMGGSTVPGSPWPHFAYSQRVGPNSVGVLWADPDRPHQKAKPLAFVVRPEDHRRFFNRFAQLRSDFSPLSAWSHILTPHQFETLEDGKRSADLGDYLAAWTGLVTAEAMLLAGRSASQLKLAACLATQSFALARNLALWPQVASTDVLQRYDAASGLVRSSGAGNRLREAIEPIWATLISVTRSEPTGGMSFGIRTLTLALRHLTDARMAGAKDEAGVLLHALRDLPEAAVLGDLEALSPEERLGRFDDLVRKLDSGASDRSNAPLLSFLAGYIATVAAGGAPSLGLAEDVSNKYPAITAWAYVIGGLGEQVTWTSAFDGLGRLVARELSRSFDIEDPPTSDFALDEAQALLDRHLTDPLVHLRIKQSRVVLVSILPGANVSLALSEAAPAEGRRQAVREAKAPTDERGAAVFDLLVDAILPRLEARLLASRSSSPALRTASTAPSKRSSVRAPKGGKGSQRRE